VQLSNLIRGNWLRFEKVGKPASKTLTSKRFFFFFNKKLGGVESQPARKKTVKLETL
jgi:hypothetical protein